MGNQKTGNKILFTDLDQTLLNDDKSISKENLEAIKKMLDEGHYFVLVTGRPIATAKIVVKELGMTKPGCYMVAFNGAVIYDCAADRILAERTLPMEVVGEIIDEAHKEGIYLQTYQKDTILAERYSRELDFYLSNARMRYRIVPDLFSSLDKEPYKMILIELDEPERLVRFQKEHEVLATKTNSFFSRNQFLEYCPAHTDKGSGIRYISEFLNIPMENTIAAGDERNDVPMAKAAKIGVAVKNAHPDMKEAADYVTERDNNHGAIAEIIEKFVLQEEA